MSEHLRKPDPIKDSGPPKKLEPRPAGAPTTREDVFTILPEHPDDTTSSGGNDDPDEEKITFKEALKEKMGKAKRLSMDLLSMKKDDSKKDDSKDGGSKTV